MLQGRRCALVIYWLQTREHDVITFFIKSIGSHVKPSERAVCVVHLFKSPIFPVKHGIICDKLCSPLQRFNLRNTLQCRERSSVYSN